MIDGMSIRKFVEWDQSSQKMVGFVDLGAGSVDDDTAPEANGCWDFWKVESTPWVFLCQWDYRSHTGKFDEYVLRKVA